jgi:tetratricopeptide (TPR) repeat protein
MKWALGPLKYDRAFQYEESAHSAFEKNDFNRAYELFVSSAKISDDNLSKSKRYRYVAISLLALNRETEALNYLEKAIILNPKNETLKRDYKKWKNRR